MLIDKKIYIISNHKTFNTKKKRIKERRKKIKEEEKKKRNNLFFLFKLSKNILA